MSDDQHDPNALWRMHRVQAGPSETLFAALAAAVPGLSRNLARQAIMAGLVKVDGAPAGDPKAALDKACRIEADLRHGVTRVFQAKVHGRADPTAAPFTVLHEDDIIIVVDKAPGVLSAPFAKDGERGHLPELLRKRWKAQDADGHIGVVHRLDRDTSGCICFARSKQAQRLLGLQFAGEAAGRTYRCIVAGHPEQNQGEITARLGHGRDGRRTTVEDGEDGKSAVTRWKVIRRMAQGCELEVELGTGRTHQIRIHLADEGFPVAGDRVYGRELPPGFPRAPRLMLHAWKLGLDHPRGGKRLEVEAPMPAAFAEFTKLLERPSTVPGFVLPRRTRPVRYDRTRGGRNDRDPGGRERDDASHGAGRPVRREREDTPRGSGRPPRGGRDGRGPGGRDREDEPRGAGRPTGKGRGPGGPPRRGAK